VTLAWRPTGTSFSATRYDTEPGPCPSVDDVNAIQLTGLAATHEHSRATLMFSVPVPPDAAWFDGVDETFASQRVDAGAVTLVEVLAELPHPIAARATTNSRGAREITARACTSFASAAGRIRSSREQRGIIFFSSGTHIEQFPTP